MQTILSDFLVMISSGGLKLATGTKEGQVHLWEVPTGLPLDALPGELLCFIFIGILLILSLFLNQVTRMRCPL